MGQRTVHAESEARRRKSNCSLRESYAIGVGLLRVETLACDLSLFIKSIRRGFGPNHTELLPLIVARSTTVKTSYLIFVVLFTSACASIGDSQKVAQQPITRLGQEVRVAEEARAAAIELVKAVRATRRDEALVRALTDKFARVVGPDIRRSDASQAIGTAQIYVTAPGDASLFPVFYGWYHGDCTGDWYIVDDLGGIHHIVHVGVPGCYYV